MIEIQYIFRKRNPQFHSIENVFYTIIKQLNKKEYSYKITRLPYFSSSLLNIILNLIFLLKRRKDINHITGDVHYASLALPSNATIITIHDVESIMKGSFLKRILIKHFWFTWPIRKATAIIAISEATKKQIIKFFHIPEYKIKVIHNPYSPLFFYRPKDFNKNDVKILTVGVTPNKNIEGLIESVKGCQNISLIILGKPTDDLHDKLQKKGIRYSYFYNLPFNNVPEIYNLADILFFASFYEGFGLPIIEAQATGRPVITSNISSMPEIAGDAAIIINPYNIAEIKCAIFEIINNDELRISLIKKGFENVRRFHPSVITKQYEFLYHEVYQKKRKSYFHNLWHSAKSKPY